LAMLVGLLFTRAILTIVFYPDNKSGVGEKGNGLLS
jgi:hypothetical protein